MVNWLHSVFHSPQRGWDPIAEQYARAYSLGAVVDRHVVDRFDDAAGGLNGKRVVDLGSGPGQYAEEFARRGAEVTCVDVSAAYLGIADKRLRAASLSAKFAIGYMDHIHRITGGGFDAVFSNVSWYYCMNDLCFGKRIASVIKPGGIAFVRAHNSDSDHARTIRRQIVYWTNERLFWKIGHPHPPHGRIAFAFNRLGIFSVACDYSAPEIDIVIARRQAQ